MSSLEEDVDPGSVLSSGGVACDTVAPAVDVRVLKEVSLSAIPLLSRASLSLCLTVDEVWNLKDWICWWDTGKHSILLLLWHWAHCTWDKPLFTLASLLSLLFKLPLKFPGLFKRMLSYRRRINTLWNDNLQLRFRFSHWLVLNFYLSSKRNTPNHSPAPLPPNHSPPPPPPYPSPPPPPPLPPLTIFLFHWRPCECLWTV